MTALSRAMLRRSFALLIAVAAFAAGAQTFERGDVILALGYSIEPFPNSPVDTKFAVYDSNGAFKRQVSLNPSVRVGEVGSHDTTVYGAAFDIVFPVAGDGTAGNALSASPGMGFVSLAFDRQGTIYAAGSDLAPPYAWHIARFSSSGTFLGLVTPPNLGPGIDLARDQCTLFYTQPTSSIARFDVCANVPLPPLSTPFPAAGRIRLLPDGRILLGSDGVYLLGVDGNLLRTYQSTPPQVLLLDPTGTAFWTTVGATVVKRDIQSGATLATIPIPSGIATFSAGVAGEGRAAVIAAPVPTIPQGSLLLLIATFVVIAFCRLHGE